MEQDTSPEQSRRYHELLRAMSPAQRARKASDLTMAVRALAVAGIKMRHPEASADEVRARLCARLYGRATALRLFPELPEDAV